MFIENILPALRLGQRIRRQSWEEKTWIQLYNPYHDKEFVIREVPVPSASKGTLIPFCGLHDGLHNQFRPYIFETTDLLADDWISLP